MTYERISNAVIHNSLHLVRLVDIYNFITEQLKQFSNINQYSRETDIIINSLKETSIAIKEQINNINDILDNISFDK
jgi:5-bromo-4-chloroindolyl phosphate hydrolysis protein